LLSHQATYSLLLPEAATRVSTESHEIVGPKIMSNMIHKPPGPKNFISMDLQTRNQF